VKQTTCKNIWYRINSVIQRLEARFLTICEKSSFFSELEKYFRIFGAIFLVGELSQKEGV